MRVAAARDVGLAVRAGSPARREATKVPRAERASATTLRLGALYQELAPRLVRVAQRLTRDALAAENVVQTAFEKALRHVADFRGDARLSTWLHRIVTNEALVWGCAANAGARAISSTMRRACSLKRTIRHRRRRISCSSESRQRVYVRDWGVSGSPSARSCCGSSWKTRTTERLRPRPRRIAGR